MKTSTIQLYSLSYNTLKTWVVAALFILGNILLPQIVHLAPQGGITWLPIYFFTLIAAYKYGWRVGVITAIASPIVNYLLFGMPAAAILPIILVKSTILSLLAGYVAYRSQRASLLMLALVVLGYQLLGSLFEWLYTGSIEAAMQDLSLGIPGIVLQIFGGWAVINLLIRK